MRANRLPVLLTLVGVIFVSLAMTQFLTGDVASLSRVHIVTNLLITGGAGIGLIYIGYHHSNRPVSAEQRIRILGWMVGGGLVLTAATILTQPIVQTEVTRTELVHILQVNMALGMLFGAAVGSFEVRALSNAAKVARTETTLETLKDEQERWGELNRLLRHYILNSMTVINYRLSELRSDVSDDGQDHLDTIEDRLQTIVTIGSHVDRLGPAPDENQTSTVSDLEHKFETASEYADVDIPLTISGERPGGDVIAGEAVEKDLALIFQALVSVMDDSGTIECIFEDSEREIAVQLIASPAELPPNVQTSLFEPIERNSGLKLYLAHTSVNGYADLRLIQNSAETVQFEIVFEKVGE